MAPNFLISPLKSPWVGDLFRQACLLLLQSEPCQGECHWASSSPGGKGHLRLKASAENKTENKAAKEAGFDESEKIKQTNQKDMHGISCMHAHAF